MNYDDVFNKFSEIIEIEKEYEKRFWIGLDGIFHDTWVDLNKELICYCGVSHSKDRGEWTVNPWLYTADCAATFKTSSSVRQMAYFWLTWMSYIYGDGLVDPKFEADWLAVKSNRSLLMMLFCQEGEILKRELWKEEGITDIGPHIAFRGITLITPWSD